MIEVLKFAPQIQVQAEGCPSLVVGPAVAQTVADICEQTGCLKKIRSYSVAANQEELIVALENGLVPDTIVNVFVDGHSLQSVLFDDLAYLYQEDWTSKTGTPRAYTSLSKGVIRFVPVPDEAVTVKVICFASVSRDATLVPEVFFTDYRDAVTYGALARVCKIAGQTFSNTRLAAMYDQLYANALKDIRSEVASDYMRSFGCVHANRI